MFSLAAVLVTAHFENVVTAMIAVEEKIEPCGTGKYGYIIYDIS